MSLKEQYVVFEISLLKYPTPQYCASTGGILQHNNDTHWGCLINKEVILHHDGSQLHADEFNAERGKAFHICVPYIFSTPVSLVTESIGSKFVSCHQTCKDIFKLLGITILVMYC
jgi:hypothetical protein